ncbi:MAG: L-threonylcarbamoyladenylate synthase [Thermodesulfobacteriota bacterium]
MSPPTPITISANKGLEEAVLALSTGGVIAYPTETFYGLAVDPANPRALKRLIELKGRPEGKAIPLIAGDLASVQAMVREISPLAERLIKNFWPGPLTLIFNASPTVSPLITGDSGGVGIRISPSPLCRRLLRATGFPLTSTSANPAGFSPPREAAEVEEYFNGKIDLIIEGGKTTGGLASTVVDVRGDKPVVLREGLIRALEIQEAAAE